VVLRWEVKVFWNALPMSGAAQARGKARYCGGPGGAIGERDQRAATGRTRRWYGRKDAHFWIPPGSRWIRLRKKEEEKEILRRV